MNPADAWAQFACVFLEAPSFLGDASDKARLDRAADLADQMTERWAERFAPDSGWLAKYKASQGR